MQMIGFLFAETMNVYNSMIENIRILQDCFPIH